MRTPITFAWCVLAFSTPPATTVPKEPTNPIKEIIHVTIPPTTTNPVEHNPRNPDGTFSADWLAGLDVPTNEYWQQVAECETAGNWKDKGQWSGGLGIYLATWRGFGGQRFAEEPRLATQSEQIEVANRIAIRGFAYDNYWQEPVGFNGWGCIKNNEYLSPQVDPPWIVEMKND